MGFLQRFRNRDKHEPDRLKHEPVLQRATKSDANTTKKASTTERTEAGVIQPHAGKGGELAFRLIARPYVSEKAGWLGECGTYVFEVAPNAEKIAIKKAIESLYKVKVVMVRTAQYQGKPSRRGRSIGRRKHWKKAYVTVMKGQSIALYEGV